MIVDGFQKLRPNAPVKPVPWKARGSGNGGADSSANGNAGK